MLPRYAAFCAKARLHSPAFVWLVLVFCLLIAGTNTAFAQAPTITSFTPTSAAAGTSITITGTNFTAATAVKFNGAPASAYTVVSATSNLFDALAAAQSQPGGIGAWTSQPTNRSSLRMSFTLYCVPVKDDWIGDAYGSDGYDGKATGEVTYHNAVYPLDWWTDDGGGPPNR